MLEHELVLENNLQLINITHSNSPEHFFMHFRGNNDATSNSSGKVLIDTTSDDFADFFTYSRPENGTTFSHAKSCLILATKYLQDITKEERIELDKSIVDEINMGIIKFYKNSNTHFFEVIINNNTEKIILNRKMVNLPLINFRKGLYNENSLLLLIEGYKKAGKVLFEIINKSSDNLELDSLVNPCIFNIRHYGELLLKDTIRKARIYLGEIDVHQIGFLSEHTYHKLYEDYTKCLIKLEVIQTADDLKEMLPFIYFFNRNDLDSYAFRYPFRRELDEYKRIRYILHPLQINTHQLEKDFLIFEQVAEGLNDLITKLIDEASEIEQ